MRFEDISIDELPAECQRQLTWLRENSGLYATVTKVSSDSKQRVIEEYRCELRYRNRPLDPVAIQGKTPEQAVQRAIRMLPESDTQSLPCDGKGS